MQLEITDTQKIESDLCTLNLLKIYSQSTKKPETYCCYFYSLREVVLGYNPDSYETGSMLI